MKLIVYNNKGTFSTVLDAFLSIAQNKFERIDVYFPKSYIDSQYKVGTNVKFHKPNLFTYVKAGGVAFCQMFSSFARNDYIIAKKTGKFDVGFLKNYFRTLVVSNALFFSSKEQIKKNLSDICVFSTWYDANAIAAAMVKYKYPQVQTMSYAHSYEVDFRKNRYTAVTGDCYKEKYLDKILFISENVMKEYIELNREFLKYTSKYETIHFGSSKKYEGIAKASDDGVFRLLSCSGISPVKRLELIVGALQLYNGQMVIEWTHLGSGNDEDKIRELIIGLGERANVRVCLKGRLTNDEVHQYYSKKNIDMFINVSASEGLPVSIMEAMSYGVPALATDVGGNSEIVTNETGYLVKADISSKELAEFFEKLTLNVNQVTEKKENAYRMWENQYQVNKNVERLVACFYDTAI